MIKFESQLAAPAMLVAAGLGPCENNSAIINQGRAPECQKISILVTPLV